MLCWTVFGFKWTSAPRALTTFLESIFAIEGSGQLSAVQSTSASSSTASVTAAAQALALEPLTRPVSNGALTSAPDSDIDMSRAEKCIVSLVTMGPHCGGQDGGAGDAVAPSKADASACLKYYRRILHAAKWRMGSDVAPKSLFDFVTGGSTVARSLSSLSSQFSGMASERADGTVEPDPVRSALEEYYAMVHIHSIVSRTIVLAYNSAEKVKSPTAVSGARSAGGWFPVADDASTVASTQAAAAAAAAVARAEAAGMSSGMSVRELFSILPAGTKSDVANALLEALEYFTSIWRSRYVHLQFPAPPKHSATRSHSRQQRKPFRSAKCLQRTYFSQQHPELPLSGLFKTISEDLPIAQSAHAAIQRIVEINKSS